MNYFNHPNLLLQFWASANEDFERILEQFVRCDGWLFQDLGVILKKSNIHLIYNCVSASTACGPGTKEKKLEHFERTVQAILDAAKTQWLAPWRNHVVRPLDGVIPPFLKRQVGGFFLLYMLHHNQPLPNRYCRKQKIIMDPKDVISMHVFSKTIQLLPKSNAQLKELARQIVVLFNDLVTSEGFEFSLFNDVFVTSIKSNRQLFTVKFCDFMEAVYKLKDIRDQHLRISHFDNQKLFQALVEYGKVLPAVQADSESFDKAEVKMKPSTIQKHWTVPEILKLRDENNLGVIAQSTSNILKSLDLGPILTKGRLMGTSEKLIKRELSTCLEAEKSRLKFLDEKRRQNKDWLVKNRDPFVSATKPVWKDYLRNDYKWVDEIFEKGRTSSHHVSANSDGNNDMEDDSVSISARNFTGHMECLEDDIEWITDNEDDDEIVEQSIRVEKTPENVFKKPKLPSKTVPRISQMKSSVKSADLNMPTL